MISIVPTVVLIVQSKAREHNPMHLLRESTTTTTTRANFAYRLYVRKISTANNSAGSSQPTFSVDIELYS